MGMGNRISGRWLCRILIITSKGETCMIRINQLKLDIHHSEADLKAKILKTLRIKEDALLSYSIQKQSIDARKKPDLFYVYAIDVIVKNESALKKHIKNKNILFREKPIPYTVHVTGTEKLSCRPVIIGTGPAGLFCGYQLALLGYRPILLERGASVDERIADVDRFWEKGLLNLNSNVQFGEGGAGTFSDGKLNTLVHDSQGRNTRVLEIFVEQGAPKEILYQNKPHIGTDILARVVKNIRAFILSHGGEVHFHTQVVDIQTETYNGQKKLTALKVKNLLDGTFSILNTNLAVLAIGHSARDTFSMLYKNGIPMDAKSFAVGIRMEHPQEMINQNQYGERYSKDLPAAAYKLTANLPNGRGVYTFCMCPGGYVVNASSESGRLAVNGMTYHARDGRNANSAVIVTVTPEDYGAENALSGVEFQRRLEEKAYQAGSGKIPVQLFADFCQNLPSKEPGNITPQMKGDYTWTNVRAIFPEELAASLEDGIKTFETKLSGYSRPDAVISGVESRTSSPVRIHRDDTMQSDLCGLYPCGEGAGYAGGITSAAMDGLKVAESIAQKYQIFDN